MDDQQLQREYQKSCMYHANPPSYETWLKSRKRSPHPSELTDEEVEALSNAKMDARAKALASLVGVLSDGHGKMLVEMDESDYETIRQALKGGA